MLFFIFSSIDLDASSMTVRICVGKSRRKSSFSIRIDVFQSNRIRIDIDGAPGTLYDGEKYQLQFKFTDQYPFDSPQVKRMLRKSSFDNFLSFFLFSGHIHRFEHSSSSSYLFEWTYMFIDLDRWLVTSIEYKFRLS